MAYRHSRCIVPVGCRRDRQCWHSTLWLEQQLTQSRWGGWCLHYTGSQRSNRWWKWDLKKERYNNYMQHNYIIITSSFSTIIYATIVDRLTWYTSSCTVCVSHSPTSSTTLATTLSLTGLKGSSAANVSRAKHIAWEWRRKNYETIITWALYKDICNHIILRAGMWSCIDKNTHNHLDKK